MRICLFYELTSEHARAWALGNNRWHCPLYPKPQKIGLATSLFIMVSSFLRVGSERTFQPGYDCVGNFSVATLLVATASSRLVGTRGKTNQRENQLRKKIYV